MIYEHIAKQMTFVQYLTSSAKIEKTLDSVTSEIMSVTISSPRKQINSFYSFGHVLCITKIYMLGAFKICLLCFFKFHHLMLQLEKRIINSKKFPTFTLGSSNN